MPFLVSLVLQHWRPFLGAFLLCLWGYTAYCYSAAKTDAKWQKKLDEAQYQRSVQIRKIEHEALSAQRAIEARYMEELAHYEQEKQHIEYMLSDTVANCDERLYNNANSPRKRMSSSSRNQSDLTCYTSEQLRRKIASSVAIASECDKEMIRFKALIESCQHGR